MKKFILSLSVCSVLLLFSNCTDEVVTIPDANFKAYLLENFDKNNDGNITLSEAKAVKEINCSNKEIKDLTGIQMFTNLESLDCSNNLLSDIEIQKNKKLNKLDCRGNNKEFQIYFGISSSLRNPNYIVPKAGGPPQNMGSTVNPIDANKCSFDEGTLIMVVFDE